MLSYRKLFSILLMMAALFSLYMLTQTYRTVSNDYNVNEYAAQSDGIRREDTEKTEARMEADGRDTVFIGDQESALGDTAAQWCRISKRRFRRFETLDAFLSQADASAGTLCIDPDCLSLPSDAAALAELTDRNMVIIFCSLPDAQAIAGSPELCELLGIEYVRSEETELTGIHLYNGFLLGGEAIYRTDVDEVTAIEEELKIPWYQLGSGTKVYITGLVGTVEEDTGHKERPPVLWRNSMGSARIFAVNGDYLRDETGLGFLSGMMAESSSYVLYPIVNAQNLSVVDFPSFAPENEEELERIYASSHRMLLLNIIWPSMVSTAEQSGFKPTCFMTPQVSDLADGEPDEDDLVYYLRQINEIHGEAGWSAGRRDTLPAADKWNRDMALWKEAGSGYVHSAVYADGQDREDILALAQSGGAPDVRTIAGHCEDGEDLLSFAAEDVTLQGFTHTADRYGFREDLKNRSIQTALGYANILLDLGCVTWPETEEDQWEHYSKTAMGNIATWWERYRFFDRTTVTESDSRVRRFLALDYEDHLENGGIELNVENRYGTVSFLLRTHDKDLKNVSGGTAVKIEKDVWLISVQEDTVRIELAVG